jgi:hypothetical protein
VLNMNNTVNSFSFIENSISCNTFNKPLPISQIVLKCLAIIMFSRNLIFNSVLDNVSDASVIRLGHKWFLKLRSVGVVYYQLLWKSGYEQCGRNGGMKVIVACIPLYF